MMALTVRSLDHAARGLASFIPSKYGFSLGSCEKSFGSVFVEDYVLPVPDLAHEFHVAQGRFCMVRVDGSDIDCLRLVWGASFRIGVPIYARGVISGNLWILARFILGR